MRRFALALITALVIAGPALAGSPSACLRPGDRVLLVSTRPVGCATDAQRLESGVYTAERTCSGWAETELDATLGSLDPTTPVVFYVHGNQITASDARRRGLDVYRRLVRCAGDERPLQFVIFSWCSDKIPGLLKDYRVKAARTRPVGAQFAWLIGRLPAGSHVGILGYSYGARVASGAAHLLGGGSLNGLRHEGSCGACQVASVRAVYLAAAYDACWNSPRAYHGKALDRIETLLTTVNPRDPAMRFYKWVPKGSDAPAFGGVGPTGLTHEQASRVRIMRVANSVGKSHDLYNYLNAPGLMSAAWRRLAYADVVVVGG